MVVCADVPYTTDCGQIHLSPLQLVYRCPHYLVGLSPTLARLREDACCQILTIKFMPSSAAIWNGLAAGSWGFNTGGGGGGRHGCGCKAAAGWGGGSPGTAAEGGCSAGGCRVSNHGAERLKETMP